MFEAFKRKVVVLPAADGDDARPVTVRSGPRKWLRRLVIGAAVFLVVFAVVGFFVVPPVAKHYAIKLLSEELGRPVSIQSIKVNPFAMTAAIGGFAIQEPGGTPTFVSFEELLVNLEYRSILRRAPVVKEITLRKPYVHIVRKPDGKTYNFSDLMEKYSKPSPKSEQKSEARFSLNNIRLLEGRVDFDDQPKRAQHALTEINFSVPFVSNLPDVVETYVEPAFSMKVNGSPLALKGRTKPFKDTLETALDLNIDKLEIPRYMEYVPVQLGFRIPSGFLDTKLAISFLRGTQTPQVMVKGEAAVTQLSMTQLDDAPLLNLAALNVPVTGIDVFGAKYQFGNIVLSAPEVFVHRARDGSLNWMAVKPASGNGGAAAPPAKETAKPDAGSGKTPMTLSVAEVTLKDGQVHFKDEVPAKPFGTDVHNIQASVRKIALPQSAPSEVDLSLATKNDESVKLAANFSLEPLASEGKLEVGKVTLKTYLPYYEDFILYTLEDGVASLDTRYAFKMAPEGAQTRLSEFNLDLSSVRMRKPGLNEDFLRVKSSQIKNADVDLNKLALNVGEWNLREGFLNIIREPDGSLNATRILPAPKEAKTDDRQGTPWLIALKQADIEKMKVAFTDLALKEPVKIVADDLRFKASGISNEKNRRGQVSLQAKLNKTGSINASGPLAINPVAADLKLDLKSFGLVPLQPYFTDKLNILLSSADLSVKGGAKVGVSGAGRLSAAFKGDVNLSDFASIEKASSEDLLKWQSLYIGGIDYNHQPMSLGIDEVALSKFYARIIIFPDGSLNLQKIAVQDAAAAGAAAAPQSSNAPPPAPAAGGRGSATPVAAPAKTATATAPASDPQAAPMPPVRVAKVTLQGGDVNFTDLFIKPNYSADLNEIGGSVTGLSSQLDTTADVDLSGRFAKTAPVVIKGKINPLVKNLFLDLRADVRDIELGPFTPYSGKYVGYAIEKGKMNFDVEYKIENRKLAAKNKLVLDQLTFGDKVESPTATKLPVLLAVALLKDRNGVIDVNLPISGSLDDPKFSVGGIVLRIIFNLIEKAVTAPFALIGNLLGGAGGGEELAFVEFDYGRAVVDQTGTDKLAMLQKALIDRPGLKLDITGRVDPEKDREGLRRYRFEQQVRAQKLKDMVKKGDSATSVDDVKIEPAEYEKYLRRAYKEAKFPKPRNAIGMTKDLPVDETEKLMLANTAVSDDDLIQLANQRAQTAKDLITREDKVPLERVFLLAPKTEAAKGAAGKDDAGKDAPGKGDRKASRVDFSLK